MTKNNDKLSKKDKETIENLIKYVPDAIINGNSVNNDSIAISEMLFDIIMP